MRALSKHPKHALDLRGFHRRSKNEIGDNLVKGHCTTGCHHDVGQVTFGKDRESKRTIDVSRDCCGGPKSQSLASAILGENLCEKFGKVHLEVDGSHAVVAKRLKIEPGETSSL